MIHAAAADAAPVHPGALEAITERGKYMIKSGGSAVATVMSVAMTILFTTLSGMTFFYIPGLEANRMYYWHRTQYHGGRLQAHLWGILSPSGAAAMLAVAPPAPHVAPAPAPTVAARVHTYWTQGKQLFDEAFLKSALEANEQGQWAKGIFGAGLAICWMTDLVSTPVAIALATLPGVGARKLGTKSTVGILGAALLMHRDPRIAESAMRLPGAAWEFAKGFFAVTETIAKVGASALDVGTQQLLPGSEMRSMLDVMMSVWRVGTSGVQAALQYTPQLITLGGITAGLYVLGTAHALWQAVQSPSSWQIEKWFASHTVTRVPTALFRCVRPKDCSRPPAKEGAITVRQMHFRYNEEELRYEQWHQDPKLFADQGDWGWKPVRSTVVLNALQKEINEDRAGYVGLKRSDLLTQLQTYGMQYGSNYQVASIRCILAWKAAFEAGLAKRAADEALGVARQAEQSAQVPAEASTFVRASRSLPLKLAVRARKAAQAKADEATTAEAAAQAAVTAADRVACGMLELDHADWNRAVNDQPYRQLPAAAGPAGGAERATRDHQAMTALLASSARGGVRRHRDADGDDVLVL